MDENHPAFTHFPTDSHSNWQWWDLCIKSKSLVIDSLDVTLIVRVIDNVTNHHLANVFEAKAGKGQMIFSSVDLSNNLEKRPTARQLRKSLLKYIESDAFHPKGEVKLTDLDFQLLPDGNKFNVLDIYG